MSESHINTLAMRKACTEGWEPFRYEVIGKDGFLITGGIPRVLARGPNKGKRLGTTSQLRRLLSPMRNLMLRRPVM